MAVDIDRLRAGAQPDGDRERTMLLGLTGNRDALAEAAARSSTGMEALSLFEVETR